MHFGVKHQDFPLFTQRYNGCHYISCKSVNHQWFIDFKAWRYITQMGGNVINKNVQHAKGYGLVISIKDKPNL